jgi:hypothetical protein
MESIIASEPSDSDVSKYLYLVKWEGFLQEENTWENYDNVAESAYELLEEYYGKNPAMEKDDKFGNQKTKRKKVKFFFIFYFYQVILYFYQLFL